MTMTYILLLLLGISVGIVIGVLCLDHRDSRTIGSLTSQNDSLLAEVKRLELHNKEWAMMLWLTSPGTYLSRNAMYHSLTEHIDSRVKAGRVR